ncbi:hypothetical protein [Paraburkholderia sp. SIMBA_054]|jgi:hypothetical protein|uniref:hypothetical protein n=1 Tax=Paraburkholderia TaxID=1822464 RepID=UPI003978209A
MAANKLVKVHAAVGERVFVATFKPTTGHLRVLEGDRTLLAMSAPDSWMALATSGRAAATGWGSHPGEVELTAFLEDYLCAGRDETATPSRG